MCKALSLILNFGIYDYLVLQGEVNVLRICTADQFQISRRCWETRGLHNRIYFEVDYNVTKVSCLTTGDVINSLKQEKKHNGKVGKCVWSTPLMSDTVCRELVEKISTATDADDYTVGLFIDLKQHLTPLTINQLERYSIRGSTHSWLTSYLDDRFQYV